MEIELLDTLEGHRARIWCVKWHPDGQVLATTGADKTIRIWGKEGDKWQCLSTLTDAHTRTIRYLAWSHDGRYLASSSFDGTVAIWQRKQSDEDECLSSSEWTTIVALEGHENEVKCCDWSPSDLYLASCSRDRTVWLWEKIDTKEENQDFFECASVLTEHSQDVKHCHWHPKLNILASAGFDNDILLYYPGQDDWQLFAKLTAHESTVWALDFDAKGARIVSVSGDESIKIWQPSNHNDVAKLLDDLETSKEGLDMNTQIEQARLFAELATKWTVVASLSGYHRWHIYDVSWSHLNHLIATAGGDNSIHIFENNKTHDHGAPRFRQLCFKNDAHDQDVNSVHWNPKVAERFASGSDDGRVRIWHIVQTS